MRIEIYQNQFYQNLRLFGQVYKSITYWIFGRYKRNFLSQIDDQYFSSGIMFYIILTGRYHPSFYKLNFVILPKHEILRWATLLFLSFRQKTQHKVPLVLPDISRFCKKKWKKQKKNIVSKWQAKIMTLSKITKNMLDQENLFKTFFLLLHDKKKYFLPCS